MPDDRPERIPDIVFHGSFRCGAVEFNVLVIILNETCRPGAPEWTRISDDELANWSGLTEPSMMDFRRRLAQRGLIDFRPVYGFVNARQNEYRPTAAVLGLVPQPSELLPRKGPGKEPLHVDSVSTSA